MVRLIRIGIVGLLFVTAVLRYSPARHIYASSGAEFEPDQVVVKLKPLLNVTIDGINQAYGTTTLAALYNHQDIYLLQTPPNTSPETLVQIMSGDPNIEWVELNFLTESPETGSSDRIYGYGWAGYDSSVYHGQDIVKVLQLDQAHEFSRGSGTVIAILDTGAQLDHPELAGSLANSAFDFVDNDPLPEDQANGKDDDGDGQVDEGYGHGTHVAGIAHLVAPESLLMPLRVLDSDGRGNDFRTANAILYGAFNNADIINLSLGTLQPSKLLSEVVKEATSKGVVVAAAAGNLNSDQKQYPAAQTCVIATTSVDSQGKKSSFANFGTWIDLASIGEKIYSTFPEDGYAYWSGTSASTPFAAGQVALLLSVDQNLTLLQAGQLIGNSAKSIDNNNPHYRGLLGEGQIDLVKSLTLQAEGSGLVPERNVLADCNP